jgi:hypothetical protein
MMDTNLLVCEAARNPGIDTRLAKRSRAQALAERLLGDRAQRATRKASPPRTRLEGADFDPFAVTRWRVVAGGDPGYLVSTPMRRGPGGWVIACGHCGAEVESKGCKYCPTCMELPAEERRSKPVISDRPCQAPGCTGSIPKRRRADAKYCTDRCAKAAENARGYQGSARPKFRGDTHEKTQQNQWPKNVLIGPGDFPISVIGGYRFSGARRLDLRRDRGRSPRGSTGGVQ